MLSPAGHGVRSRTIARCLTALAAIALLAPPFVVAQPPLPRLEIDQLPDDARKALAPAAADAAAHPDDPAKVGALGMQLQAWEQWRAASAAYARADALQPTFDWAYLAGFVATRLGDHEAAVKWFTKALEHEPSSVPARLRLADALFDTNAIDRGAALYEALRSVPQAEPHARYGLGRTLVARGKYVEAVAELRRAVALFPRFAAAWYALGLALRHQGDLSGAADALARAAQHGTDWPAVEDPLLARVRGLRDDGRALLARGIALDREGDLQGAIREHEAALAARPDLVQAHLNLIVLYGRLGDLEKARTHYDAVLASGTSLAEAHYNFGVLLLQQKRLDEAEAAFRAAIAANPQHAGALVNLGSIEETRGNLAGALEDYRRAVDAAPANRMARFNLGRMQLARKQYDDAAATFERLAEEPSPDRARYLFGLATARVQAGRVEEGLTIARRAREEAARANNTELVAAIDRELARVKR